MNGQLLHSLKWPGALNTQQLRRSEGENVSTILYRMALGLNKPKTAEITYFVDPSRSAIFDLIHTVSSTIKVVVELRLHTCIEWGVVVGIT